MAKTGQHLEYHYSITIKTDDNAVLNCLRALAQHSQRHGNNRIPWGNTKDSDWDRDGHQVTFHFTKPQFRSLFVSDATRLLPQELWTTERTNDHDPARSAN